MRGEEEHLLGHNRVWIEDPINPVPSGTYSRYYTSKKLGERLNITFKRIDLSEEVYNKRLTTMSIELISHAPRKTDTRVNINIFSPTDWETHSLIRKPHYYDTLFPRILGVDQTNQQPPIKQSRCATITAQELREVHCAGFFIENCGNRHLFPTEEIIEVTSDHNNRSITIKRKGTYGEPIRTTYSLKKISNCGALPKHNQKVI